MSSRSAELHAWRFPVNERWISAGQDQNGVGVQHDSTVTLVLGVLLPRLLAVLADRSLNVKDAVGQVDVTPASATEFSAPVPGHHREPDERAPVGVFPRLGNDARGLIHRRRPRVRFRRRRRLGEVDWVDRHPLQANGPPEGSAEDLVNVEDARLA
jgi:hypothetical protein